MTRVVTFFFCTKSYVLFRCFRPRFYFNVLFARISNFLLEVYGLPWNPPGRSGTKTGNYRKTLRVPRVYGLSYEGSSVIRVIRSSWLIIFFFRHFTRLALVRRIFLMEKMYSINLCQSELVQYRFVRFNFKVE